MEMSCSIFSLIFILFINQIADSKDTFFKIGLNRQEHVVHGNEKVQTRTSFVNDEILDKWIYRLAGSQHDSSIAARSSFFIKRLQNHSDQPFYFSVYYTGVVTLGTPPQLFNFVFDTGTADTGILSANVFIKSKNDLIGKVSNQLFNPVASSTYLTYYKSPNMTSDYDYIEDDNNQPQAVISADTLGIVGVGKVKNQVFFEIVDLNNRYHLYTYFKLMKSSGVFGLAYSSESTNGITPILQNMIQQKLIFKPIFSLSLSRTNGEITFGGIDSSKYRGKLTWINVIGLKYWKINAPSHLFLNFSDCTKAQIRTEKKSGKVLLDSTYSRILGPVNEFEQLCNLIGGISIEVCYVTCEMFRSLPNISFNFGAGAQYFITPNQYILQYNIASCKYYGDSYIIPTIFLGQDFNDKTGAPLWIFGNVFFQAVYAVFDFGNRRVGFANAT